MFSHGSQRSRSEKVLLMLNWPNFVFLFIRWMSDLAEKNFRVTDKSSMKRVYVFYYQAAEYQEKRLVTKDIFFDII